MRKTLSILCGLVAGVAFGLPGAAELPVAWQRFVPAATTNGVSAAESLTVATVSFDANVPVGEAPLEIEARVKTNISFIASIVRQVKTACDKKGTPYRESSLLVCFPEDSNAGINERKKGDAGSWRDFRDGVMGTREVRPEIEWDRLYAGTPFPRDEFTCALREIAVSENVYLCCSYETRDVEGRNRNVCTLFGPEESQFGAEYGVIGYHYKVHPIGGEKYDIARGDVFRVWPTKIGRIGMMICYDLMFPESARSYGVQGADLVLVATAWIRNYPEGYPDGGTYELGGVVSRADGPGMEIGGKDDGCRTFVDFSVRTAALQNGCYFAISSLANPGGIAYSSIVYPSGRILCEARGERLSGETDDRAARYRPGIAIANIGVPSRAREISVRDVIGFDMFEDRYIRAYRPLTEEGIQ